MKSFVDLVELRTRIRRAWKLRGSWIYLDHVLNGSIGLTRWPSGRLPAEVIYRSRGTIERFVGTDVKVSMITLYPLGPMVSLCPFRIPP